MKKTAILRLGAPLEGGIGFTGNVRYWSKLYVFIICNYAIYFEKSKIV